MKIFYFSIILFLLSIQVSIGQIDDFIQNEMMLENIPGISACVVKNQEIVWSNAYGIADFETNIAVETTTLFTVASISKLFVATAIMQVYEDGLIDLDTDVNEYLDFDVKNPNFPNAILTIRQLLQHRSSLRDPEGDMYDYWEEGDHSADLHDFLENILSPAGNNYHANYYNSNAGPGSTQWYSNIGFSLLAIVIEQLTDMPYHSYCKVNVFEPLCMDNTTFFWSETDVSNTAMPHRYVNGEYQALGRYSIALYPSALIKTNVIELANFMLAYTGRGTVGGVQLLESSSVDLLTPYDFTSENLAWWNGTNWTFTFHFPDDEVWFHGGYMPGIRTRLNYYSDDSTGVIILTNGEGQYGWIEEELAANIANFVTTSPTELPCMITNLDVDKKTEIEIYPSPSNGTIQIGNSNVKSIKIHDMTAKEIPFQSTSDFQSVYVKSKGLFILEIELQTGEILLEKIAFY
jgi:CubicO group peptidase (beta-lactamase class C family)